MKMADQTLHWQSIRKLELFAESYKQLYMASVFFDEDLDKFWGVLLLPQLSLGDR